MQQILYTGSHKNFERLSIKIFRTKSITGCFFKAAKGSITTFSVDTGPSIRAAVSTFNDNIQEAIIAVSYHPRRV